MRCALYQKQLIAQLDDHRRRLYASKSSSALGGIEQFLTDIGTELLLSSNHRTFGKLCLSLVSLS